MLKVRMVFLAVAALAILGWFVRLTAAQSPLAIGFDEAFTPDFLRRDLPAFKAELRLDAEQAAIMESLLGDYQEQFQQALATVRTELRDAQTLLGAEDPAVDEHREQIRKNIADMFEQMQEDLKTIDPGMDAGEIRMKYEREMSMMQEELKGLQPKAMPAEQVAKIFNDASVRLETWRGVKKQMREKFVADAQAILRPEQKDGWQSLERRLRRDKSLPRGRLQGESVNLLTVVSELNLDEQQQQSVAAMLEEYQARLDQALIARNDLIVTSDRALFVAVQSGDRAAVENVVDRITKARVAVRNANDDSAAAIAAALPEGSQSAFMQVFRQRGYPLVFRDTQTLRLLKMAQEASTLSAAQVSAIQALQAEYEQVVAPVNDDVLRQVRENEPTQVTVREVNRLLPPSIEEEAQERERDPGAMQAAFSKRADLGRPFDQRLEAIVGFDIFDTLPRGEPPPEPEESW